MMKKVLACCLIICMLLPAGVVFAASFPDLPESHWAHADVAKMVADGRVNGFPDGEFKPNENVTRWQFVKMMGGSDPDATSEPHRPATRGEAAEFLWIKAGKPTAVAPSAVTKNTVSVPAAAWAYTSGIMEGDDGLNLRLDSTLTRAEAAALIIRSESGNLAKNDFINTVDPKILTKVWDAMLTGKEYNESATLTNGEIAAIAVRYGYEKRTPVYPTLTKLPDFESEYAKDMQLVAQECLGEDKATKEFCEKEATVQDMIAVFSFYAMKQSAEPLSYSPEKTYSDAKQTATMADMGLRFARHNGVILYADESIKAENKATMKDAACVLLQLDEILGLNKSSVTVKPLKLAKNLYGYPKNSKDYAYILDCVPGASYETALIEGVKPVDSYDFANDFSSMFETFLRTISVNLPKSVKLEWTFIPSLVAESKDDLVIRAGLKIVENPENLTLNQIFAKNTLDKEYTGNSFYVDISVGEPISDIVISTANYKVIRAFIG